MYRHIMFAAVLLAVAGCDNHPSDGPMLASDWISGPADQARIAGQAGPDTLPLTYNGEAMLPSSLWQ